MELEQESNINFIPCVKWVTRGVASTNPTKVIKNRNCHFIFLQH